MFNRKISILIFWYDVIQYNAMVIRSISVAEKFDSPIALIEVRGVEYRFADKVNPAWWKFGSVSVPLVKL